MKKWRIVALLALAVVTGLGKAGVIPPVVPAILGPVAAVLLPVDGRLQPDGVPAPEPSGS